MALLLVAALAMHWAAVGLIGLMIIVLQTAFNGVIEEHQIGHAFEEALPFTALLVVFFAIVAVIHDQHLFSPVIDAVLAMESDVRPAMFFLANGILSMISDNVFVATVYITEVKNALLAGNITREEFDHLAIAINTGTNLPSVATPNGQAAFLFLLTSALAPLIRLSYGRMVVMALPYTLVMGGVGLACVKLVYLTRRQIPPQHFTATARRDSVELRAVRLQFFLARGDHGQRRAVGIQPDDTLRRALPPPLHWLRSPTGSGWSAPRSLPGRRPPGFPRRAGRHAGPAVSCPPRSAGTGRRGCCAGRGACPAP